MVQHKEELLQFSACLVLEPEAVSFSMESINIHNYSEFILLRVTLNGFIRSVNSEFILLHVTLNGFIRSVNPIKIM